jgi:hypothetical protein
MTAIPLDLDTVQADDPHAGWLRRLTDLRLRADRTESDAAREAMSDEMLAIEARIAATPAHSLDGAVAQLELVLLYLGEWHDRHLATMALQRSVPQVLAA